MPEKKQVGVLKATKGGGVSEGAGGGGIKEGSANRTPKDVISTSEGESSKKNGKRTRRIVGGVRQGGKNRRRMRQSPYLGSSWVFGLTKLKSGTIRGGGLWELEQQQENGGDSQGRQGGDGFGEGVRLEENDETQAKRGGMGGGRDQKNPRWGWELVGEASIKPLWGAIVSWGLLRKKKTEGTCSMTIWFKNRGGKTQSRKGGKKECKTKVSTKTEDRKTEGGVKTWR